MIKEKLKIYLCDLTYDTILLVSDTIPINIGFIASYIKKYQNNEVEISLFKYPNSVIEAIKKNPPDMIALSSYSWNSNLSEYVSSITKKFNPNAITIHGGTNFPHKHELQKIFLQNRPHTDIHTLFEGERALLSVVKRILESNLERKKIFELPIDGCVFIHPDTKKFTKVKQKFVIGKSLERIKDLDEIPSPYLNGILDKFFDGKLTPFLETNRGCPFTCSFCHTGSDYYHKLNKFSSERVKEEIEYIGKRSGALHISNLHMADVNFGMYQQDKKVCEWLMESKKKYRWPLQVMATTGKNAKERIIAVTNVLDPGMINLNMSAQSMDHTVLKNIKRSNIKVSVMKEVNNELRQKGRMTKSELILPLPGETKESFIKGIDDLLDSNACSLTIYTLMMLHGTEFQDPEFREKFGYTGKYRIVPLNFGEYENKRIFDYEEAGVATKDMSFDDYVYLRSIALMVESLINGRPFEEFFQYVESFGITKANFLKRLRDNVSKAPKLIQKLFAEFIEDTQSELWDSEKDLLNHYRKDENFQLLKQGKVGGNLIYKYKIRSLVFASNEWIKYLQNQLCEIALEKYKDIYNKKKVQLQIDELGLFCKMKLNGFLDGNSNYFPKTNKFTYDILSWINHKDSLPLSKFELKDGITYSFEFSEDQKAHRADVFKRWGTDINSLSKIVTRITSLESQFRKIRLIKDNHLQDIYSNVKADNFARYALVN